jgi:hypothetical protein
VPCRVAPFPSSLPGKSAKRVFAPSRVIINPGDGASGHMSALSPKADISRSGRHDRFGPEGDLVVRAARTNASLRCELTLHPRPGAILIGSDNLCTRLENRRMHAGLKFFDRDFARCYQAKLQGRAAALRGRSMPSMPSRTWIGEYPPRARKPATAPRDPLPQTIQQAAVQRPALARSGATLPSRRPLSGSTTEPSERLIHR